MSVTDCEPFIYRILVCVAGGAVLVRAVSPILFSRTPVQSRAMKTGFRGLLWQNSHPKLSENTIGWWRWFSCSS